MRCALFVLVMIAAVALPAGAQTRRPAPTRPRPRPAERVFVSVDGMYQAATQDFNDSASFPSNAETGTFSTDYQVKPGPAFDITGSAYVWKQLLIGIGVTRFSRSTPVALTASIPHPFFFNRPRSLSGDLAGFSREELAVHVQARMMVPTSMKKMQVMVFGGPSFFTVKQDVLNQVGYTESFPYDTVSSAPGQSGNESVSKVGFNGGADISYFFTRQVGVGGTAQYAGASIDLASAGGDIISVKVGGFQSGGGLRLRF